VAFNVSSDSYKVYNLSRIERDCWARIGIKLKTRILKKVCWLRVRVIYCFLGQPGELAKQIELSISGTV